MSYNTKNYTEQGGEVTHIGGKLIIDEGGSVEGLPSADSQAPSEATTVAGIKDDFNTLLASLKDIGVVTKDTFTVGAGLIPTPTEEDLVFNHSKVSEVEIEDNEISITCAINELRSFASSDPTQGTHKWIGLAIATGEGSILGIKYNGTYDFAQADVDEATSVGCPAGSFVLYIKADEVINEAKTITLNKKGFEKAGIVIRVFDNQN